MPQTSCVVLCAAGSGHAGGTLSIMDIAAALYLKVGRLGLARERSHQRKRSAVRRSGDYGAIGVKDRFGDSGHPWELIKEFEVSAEHITQKAAELVAVEASRVREEATVMR